MPAMLFTASFLRELWSFLSSAVAVLCTTFFFLRAVPWEESRNSQLCSKSLNTNCTRQATVWATSPNLKVMRHFCRQKHISTILKFFLNHKRKEIPNSSIFFLPLTQTTKILLNIKQYVTKCPQDIFSKTKHKFSGLNGPTLATKSLTLPECSTDSNFGIPALQTFVQSSPQQGMSWTNTPFYWWY